MFAHVLASSAAVPHEARDTLQPQESTGPVANWAPFGASTWHEWRSRFSIEHMQRLVQCVRETTPAKPPKPTENALTICKTPQQRPCQTPLRKPMTAKELEWYVLERHELSDMDADNSACYFILSIPSRMDMARNAIRQLRQRGAKGRVMVMRGLEPQNPLNGSKAPWDDEGGKTGEMVNLIWNFYRDRGLPLASGNLCPRRINIFMEDDVELCTHADEIVAQARRAPLAWLGYTNGGSFGAQMWSLWKEAIPAAHEAYHSLKAGFVDHAFLKTMMAPLADRSLASTLAHHDVEPKKYWECDDEAKAAPKVFPDWWAAYRAYAGGKLPSTCVINVTRSAEALMELDVRRAQKRTEKYDAEQREAAADKKVVLAAEERAEQHAESSAAMQDVGLDDFAHMLATSGHVRRAFTCMVDDLEKTCPGTSTLSKLGKHHWYLKPNPNEKWLFYGPSYMSQIFQVVLAANKDDIVERSLIGDDGEVDVSSPYNELTQRCKGPAKLMNRTTSLIAPVGCGASDDVCNVAVDPDCACDSPSGTPKLKLKNGAEIYGIVNAQVFQDQLQESVIKVLHEWLNQPNLTLDHIFYMEPHGAHYWAEHCIAEREGRKADDIKVLDPNKIDMCFQHNMEVMGLEDGGKGVRQSTTTAAEYVKCVKTAPAYKMMFDHVTRHGTSMMIVAPWAVMPSTGLYQNPPVYTSFEAGHKYSCVAGGSTPGSPGFGVGSGICPWADDQPMRMYLPAPVPDPRMYYQSQHPCVVICEPHGPGSCVAGPAARMAVDIISRARHTPIPWDNEDYTGFADLRGIYAMQACGNSTRQ